MSDVEIRQACLHCLCKTCKHDCFMCDKLCEFDPGNEPEDKGIEKCIYYEHI